MHMLLLISSTNCTKTENNLLGLMARKRKRSKPRQKTVIYQGVRLVAQTVDNPYYNPAHDDKANPKHIKAMVSVSDAPSFWHSRKLITDSEYQAALRFRRIYEAAQAGAQAIDYSAVKVDTFGPVDPISAHQLDAVRELVKIEQLLGGDYGLTVKLCGLCLPLRAVYGSNNQYRQRKGSKATQRALKTLSAHFGFETR